ncbi:glutathione S-transferase family protein [Croceibacterium sp. TMG7-5b_MA50]|uniref:glutathione S-transferase family protein n=1 Tax=Croceibacterium sp. TMG7-5b_MA50 TaxID=3121290 RepID=UPI0032219246
MNLPATLSAFEWVPDFARGHVRDLRVRWACEEIDRPYDAVLLDATRPRGPDYTCWQPFGQVPAWREGTLSMFESGAILLHLGETDERLLPSDPQTRWQAISWLFAALNSVEPYVGPLVDVRLFHADRPWAEDAFATFRPAAEQRLTQLSDAIGEREWLAGPFSIADIAMATVLKDVSSMNLLDGFPTLDAYLQRACARPAYARALQAQLDDFRDQPKAT